MKLIIILVVCLGIWNANGLPTEEDISPQTALDQDSDFQIEARSARGSIYYRAHRGLSNSERQKIVDMASRGMPMYGTTANALQKHIMTRLRSDYGSHKWACLYADSFGYSFDGGISKMFLLKVTDLDIRTIYEVELFMKIPTGQYIIALNR